MHQTSLSRPKSFFRRRTGLRPEPSRDTDRLRNWESVLQPHRKSTSRWFADQGQSRTFLALKDDAKALLLCRRGQTQERRALRRTRLHLWPDLRIQMIVACRILTVGLGRRCSPGVGELPRSLGIRNLVPEGFRRALRHRARGCQEGRFVALSEWPRRSRPRARSWCTADCRVRCWAGGSLLR